MIFWLSFCDMKKPKGQRFLGACYVEADSFKAAIQKTWRLGINPGGEVIGFPIRPHQQIHERWMNRLLSHQECLAFERDPEGVVSVN